MSARRLTAAALDRMPRRKRIRALWDAMSPSARERAWEALDEDQRVDAVAVLFDATESHHRPALKATFSGAIDRWQREAER